MTRCELRVAGYGVRVANCGLRVAGCGVRGAGYGLRVSRFGIVSIGDFGLRIGDCSQGHKVEAGRYEAEGVRSLDCGFLKGLFSDL